MSLEELLRQLAVADHGPDAAMLVDDIEQVVEEDPAGSRAAIWAFHGDEAIRLRLIGFLGDPRDFEFIAAALANPHLRDTALECLANQPDAGRVDEVARSFLGDTDPAVRSRAARIVSFRALPGALEALLPLAEDPVAQVRTILGWELGGLRDRAAEPALRRLLADPDDQVRKFAAHGLERLDRRASAVTVRVSGPPGTGSPGPPG